MMHRSRSGRIILVVTSLIAAALGVVLPASSASATPMLGALAGAGPRVGATRLSFYAGDSVKAQVDVGSGNLLVTVRLLTLPDVSGPLQLGAYYNSAVGITDTTLPRLGGRGWGLDYTDDVRMVPETSTPSTSAVTYRAPGGAVGVFIPVAGSNNPIRYSSPAGFESTLTYDSTGYRLIDNQTQQTRTFNATGLLTAVKDRNGNSTTTTPGSSSTTIRTAASTLEPSTAIVSKPTTTTTQIKQGSSTTLRTDTFTTSGETVSKFTDALGRSTSFDYYAATGTSAGLLKRITAPGGVLVSFSYDAQNRVYAVDSWDPNLQANLDTRFQHTTVNGVATTYVADPTTSGGQNPIDVPHTTYSLDSTNRVTQVIDAMGRQRATSYTPNFDANASLNGSGLTSALASGGPGASGNQALPQSESSISTPGSPSYTSTAGPALYLPTASTDDAGNGSIYAYDGAGNELTSTAAGGGAENTLTYNADGTVATALGSDNGSNRTAYGYTNKQLSSVTPVTGSSLGTRAFTYDTMGRLKTATDGRGVTRTFTYDNLDRVTKVAFSDGTQVSYGYDSAGNLATRSDLNGTTTWTWDPLGRLTNRKNTYFGGLVTYGYDKASRLISSNTSLGGTITYGYDLSGLPIAITYPVSSGGSGLYTMEYDTHGREKAAKLGVTNGGSSYQASATYSYNSAGKVISVTANTGPGTANVVDYKYCYVTGTTAGGACTPYGSASRAKVQWRRDATQYETATYAYDTQGRITQQSGVYDGNIAGNSYQYTYDNRGNRLTATPAPSSNSGSQSLTFNAANQISTAGYSYDGAGNLTAEPATGTTGVTYTAADQVKAGVGSYSSFAIKYAGTSNAEMLDQASVDGDYSYLYGRTNQYGQPTVEQMTRVVNQGGTTNTYNTSFINNPVTGQPLIQVTHTGAVNMYVYAGTNGASIELLAANGNVALAERYDPYGVPIIAQGYGSDAHEENPYDFDGGGVEMRITGWIHMGDRYLSPLTGSFTQQSSTDAPLDLANANRYSFAGGDPVNNVQSLFASSGGANHSPNAPGNFAASPGTGRSTTSLTPTLSTIVTDPDGGTLNTTFTILQDGSPVWTATVAATPDGLATVSVPANKLVDGQLFRILVTADDGDISSTAAFDLSVATSGDDDANIDTGGYDELEPNDVITLPNNGAAVSHSSNSTNSSPNAYHPGDFWDSTCPGDGLDSGDRYHHVADYYRLDATPQMIGTQVYLNCGITEPDYPDGLFGLRHIRHAHKQQFEVFASAGGAGSDQWGNVMDGEIAKMMRDPARVMERNDDDRYCYEGTAVAVFGTSTYPLTIVAFIGKSGRRSQRCF